MIAPVIEWFYRLTPQYRDAYRSGYDKAINDVADALAQFARKNGTDTCLATITATRTEDSHEKTA